MNLISYRGPGVAGGVSSGLKQVFTAQSEHDSRWFFLSDEGDLSSLEADEEDAVTLAGIDEKIIEGHYRFCNEFIWPIMHDRFSYIRFSDADYQYYRSFNAALTAAIAAETHGHLAFVQDYQLALIPGLLSARGYTSKMFWHIPWPETVPAKFLGVISELAKGMLATSVLGFHTEEYANNFMAFVADNLPQFSVNTDRALVVGRSGFAPLANRSCTEIIVQSLGIDLEFWTDLAHNKSAGLPEELATESPLPMVLSVDRVDYTKAVFDRFEIIDRFFSEFPEWLGKIRFVQLCSRSRKSLPTFDKYYRDCRSKYEEVNGRWETATWQPILWLQNGVSPAGLAALYKHAAVMLVNPVRDGLNLTAEEFAACQSLENPGVLLLSPGAGAWEELGDDALEAHPARKNQAIESILEALQVPLEERSERMQNMQQKLCEHSSTHWWNRFAITTLPAKSSDMLRRAV